MRDVNSVVLVGRLTKDAELSYLPNGTPRCVFSLAINGPGTKEKRKTMFVDCVAWRFRAEDCSEFKKGDQVWVSGYLDFGAWEDAEGKKHKRSSVGVDQAARISRPKKEDPTE